LPDLKEKKRLGSVKILPVNLDYSGKMSTGWSGDFVVFLTPRAIPINQQNFSELLGDNKPNFFYTIYGSKNAVIYKKMITTFFIWRVLQKENN